VVARLARDVADHCAKLTISIKRLAQEITQLAEQLAPAVLALSGCGPLTAAKIIGDTADAIGSNLSTPTPATTALHPCQSAPRTRPDTDLAAPETGNSTPIAPDRAHPSSLMPCFKLSARTNASYNSGSLREEQVIDPAFAVERVTRIELA
jgi:transposase